MGDTFPMKVSPVGALQTVEFERVGNSGWDVYRARYERGTMQWRIALSSQGIITGALLSAGP